MILTSVIDSGPVCSQKERFDLLYKSCHRKPSMRDIDDLTNSEIKKLSRNLFVAENLKTLACIHYKVAWTTQRVIFANNSAKDPIPGHKSNSAVWRYLKPNNVRKLSHQMYSLEDKRHRLKHYFKYMFTRHPLDRVLSAFKDKLELEMEDGHGNYYRRLLPKIANLVHPELLRQRPLEDIRMPYVDVLKFLKAGGKDMHFSGPYENKCQPCVLKYDYLAKVETFDKDMDYIIDHQFPAKRGKNTLRNTWGTPKIQKIKFYKELKEYEELPEELIHFAVSKYSRDFEQYGYTTDRINGKCYATCKGSCC